VYYAALCAVRSHPGTIEPVAAVLETGTSKKLIPVAVVRDGGGCSPRRDFRALALIIVSGILDIVPH
jgi:hypothetical protein